MVDRATRLRGETQLVKVMQHLHQEPWYSVIRFKGRTTLWLHVATLISAGFPSVLTNLIRASRSPSPTVCSLPVRRHLLGLRSRL